MKLKAFLCTVFSVFLIAIIIPSVSSLGLTPPRNTIHFDGALTQKNTITLLNTDSQDLKFNILVEGDMAQYIDVSPKLFYMNSTDNKKDITYSISLPNYVGEPGVHKTMIIFLANSGSAEQAGANVVASSGLAHQVEVIIPEEGKYIGASLIITPQDHKKRALFTIPLFNRGTEKIDNITAVIDIYDPVGNLVKTLHTSSVGLDLNSESKVSARVSSDEIPSGKYSSVATIYFDGYSHVINEDFQIGSSLFNLVSLDFENFDIGKIIRMSFKYENTGNTKINNVYSNIKVYSSNNNLLSDFNSEKVSADPQSVVYADAFWDTQGIKDGNYSLIVTTHHGEESFTNSFIITIDDNKLNGDINKKIDIIKKKHTGLIILFLVLVSLVFLTLAYYNYLINKKIGKKK